MHKKLFLLSFLSFILIPVFSQISNPVKWKFDYKVISENSVELVFTADIDHKFHMYGANFSDGGPVRTSFRFDSTTDFQLLGKIIEKTPPVKKHDESFDMDITIHSKNAIFTQLVKVKSARTIIKGSLEYMACTDEKCLPPVEKSFTFEINLPAKSKVSKIDSSKNNVVSGNIENKKYDSLSEAQTIISQRSESISVNNKTDNQSLWQFFIIALIAGFIGVLTPCVYPMIPMTVSFFMRGNQSYLRGIVNGIIFGISIIAIYTAIGFVISFTGSGANVANQISTHWLANLIFFLLFVIFSASFFGMFELVLPGSIVNRADKQADKGGIMGIVFMALVTVLVSFSCTGPIVGGILIEAEHGVAAKPILGMFGFGLAFALPFTFFAIFPSSLKSLPKSGGWLNSVKVVLGFLMLALSLKFVVNIDQAYHLNFISREIFLAIWISISILLTLYLLGKIRFAHDSKIETVSVPRIFLAIATLSFAVYLFTGFLGNSLSAFSSVLPPQTETKQIGIAEGDVSGNLCEKPKYYNLFHLPYGLKGYFDYKQGLACAGQLHKPVFFDFKGFSCSNCKVMEATVWNNKDIQKLLSENFVIIALYADDKTKLPESDWVKSQIDSTRKKTIGQVNSNFQVENFKNNSLPMYVITDENLQILTDPIGYEPSIDKFRHFLENGISKYNTRKSLK